MIGKLKTLLTTEIRETKNLKNLDFNYIYGKLEKFILTYGDTFKKLHLYAQKKGLEKIEKSKPFKEIVKKVRNELHIIYGSFLTNNFHSKQQPQTQDEIMEILKTHKSTKERLNYYNEIYSKIFTWYKPQQIGDLACGLNPLSYFLMKQNVKYFASDLSPTDMTFIQNFFDKFNIQGIAKAYDITNLQILKDTEFQKCDLIFLFKALDSFEETKKNISKDLLTGINAKHIVISFPTKSLISQKNFKIEKRNWLFNFLNKMQWQFEKFEIDNELFILINKN